MPERECRRHRSVGLRRFHDLVPLREALPHQEVLSTDRLEHRHHLDHWRREIDQLLRCRDRLRVITLHAVGYRQKIQIVRVVHRVNALHPGCFEISFIGGRGIDIRTRGRVVVSHAFINVRRHVHEVSGHRHQLRQVRRVSERALGMRRGFDRVDIVMNRAGMIPIALKN